jgi:hypothetical protein
MTPRPKPLAPPLATNARYWTVASSRGDVVCRHPFYGVGARVVLYTSAEYVDPVGDERPLQERYATLLPCAGAVVGVCWADLNTALDTPVPKDLSPSSLAAFGASVAEELQEAGWNLMEIVDLFGKVQAGFLHRQSLVAMAEERADYFGAPTEDLTIS